MAPGGLLITARRENNYRGPCVAWRLTARRAPTSGSCKNNGAERALAPGGELVPLGGLERFRLAAWMLGQAKCCCSCFVLCIV